MYVAANKKPNSCFLVGAMTCLSTTTKPIYMPLLFYLPVLEDFQLNMKRNVSFHGTTNPSGLGSPHSH